MTLRPLPKFDNPPVVEVALSISFESLKGYRSAHAGRLWERLKSEFPTTENQPELGTAIELPGGPSPQLRLEQLERLRIRTWLQSADQTQLLQVQHNRIVYNWKRGEVSQPYPSYEAVEQRFLDLLPRVADFFASEGLGHIVPVQSEVTYVNHIDERHDRISDVVNVWRKSAEAFPPPVEDARFSARYVIPDAKGEMIGRLNVDLQPVYITSTRAEILKLDLTARGAPSTRDIDGAVAFLRLGHEWIVSAFAQITTEEMHAKWKRRQ